MCLTRKTEMSMCTLTAAVVCATFTLAGASGQETSLTKRVSVDYRNVPLADVLKDLENKAGMPVAAPADLLKNCDPVTYSANDQEAGRVLTRILHPHGLKLENPEGSRVTVTKLGTHEEFKVKREDAFAFVQKPRVTREGDRVAVSFETMAFCDATVAIEDAQGRILRHLASGVLGENAPEPFQWNSKKQTLVWDGKNDKGQYVDDKESITVRVSLGLKPQFERTLYWSPKKIGAWGVQAICAVKEGVYVYQHHALRPGHAPKLMLFDHAGNYVRTVYPFPRNRLGDVEGLQWAAFPPSDEKFPIKWGTGETSLLTLGNLATLSPDGKWLYLAGYLYVHEYGGTGQRPGAIHGVFRMDPAGNTGPQLFLGRHNNVDFKHFFPAVYRWSHVACPIQLKCDLPIDNADRVSMANMRSLLLGAILVGFPEHPKFIGSLDRIKTVFRLYNTRQRGILRGADVYRILPLPPVGSGQRPVAGGQWLGMQYFNTSINKGSVLLWQNGGPSSQRIKLKGLDRSATYTLTFEDAVSLNGSMTGAQLMDAGVDVPMGPNASEIIWLNATSKEDGSER
jgi:hypothetical protein